MTGPLLLTPESLHSLFTFQVTAGGMQGRGKAEQSACCLNSKSNLKTLENGTWMTPRK